MQWRGLLYAGVLALLLATPVPAPAQASSLGSVEGWDGHPIRSMEMLIGTWDIFPDSVGPPSGRVAFTWGLRGKTIHKEGHLLVGEHPGPIAEGLIGFNPASNRLVGIDFQTMLWPGERMVHIMFESEYWVTENEVRRLYTVNYPVGERLMPMPELGGNTRSYRETYARSEDGTIRWFTHILDHGEWKAFGQNPNGSLLRPAAPEEGAR